MKYKYVSVFEVVTLILLAFLLGFLTCYITCCGEASEPAVKVVVVPIITDKNDTEETVKENNITKPELETLLNKVDPSESMFKEQFTSPNPETTLSLTQDEIDLIALITMGEAEGESELGQRLVISTILNRVDSERFPDTVHDVIYQPNAFSVVWNDRLSRCEVQEPLVQLVKDELAHRTNSDVMFFNANHYSKYGRPLFQEGGHYFSAY